MLRDVEDEAEEAHADHEENEDIQNAHGGFEASMSEA
jgi:hypothetical protein